MPTFARTRPNLLTPKPVRVKILEAKLNSGRAQRANRSRRLLQARRDPDLRSQLLTNPKAVLSSGFEIPNAATVTVMENSLEHLDLVIPCIHYDNLESDRVIFEICPSSIGVASLLNSQSKLDYNRMRQYLELSK